MFPASGPGLMMISFSGSSHFVVGVMAFQRYREAEAAAADEDVLHLLGHRLLGHFHRTKIDVQRAVRVPALRQAWGERKLEQDLMSAFLVLDVVGVCSAFRVVVGDRHGPSFKRDRGAL